MNGLQCKLCKNKASTLTDSICSACRQETFAPIIHLNGTSKKSLMDALDGVYVAVNEALVKLRETAPNGRDYYPKPGLLEKAEWQHFRRMELLTNLMKSFERQMELIDAQG